MTEVVEALLVMAETLVEVENLVVVVDNTAVVDIIVADYFLVDQAIIIKNTMNFIFNCFEIIFIWIILKNN